MKFGKRLEAEATRSSDLYKNQYIDYKALKHAIKTDVEAQDPAAPAFDQLLRQELQKVEAFYKVQEMALEGAVASTITTNDASKIASLRSELQDLRKFVVLNYIAVVKAVKKRNRHLKQICGGQSNVTTLKAVNILAGEYFFTSLKLANLTTRAEIAAREVTDTSGRSENSTDVAADFTCAICLNLLHNPVVLSCAHRFCWGCLVAYGSAVKHHSTHQIDSNNSGKKEEEPSSPTATIGRPAIWESESSDDENHPTVATFGCPCCRKDQLLDLDKLQVDPHLSAFVERLATESTTITLSAPLTITKPAAAVPTEIDATKSSSRQSSGSLLEAIAEVEMDCSTSHLATTTTQVISTTAVKDTPSDYLLPPQLPCNRGRLTVCLDIDGTLLTTFTPKRAPTLHPSMVGYIVGKGSKLNPGGVYVLERPGLGEFLKQVSSLAEVVIFTAGLEDYAGPICDELERRYGKFVHRLYRTATTHSEVYPCVKDLSRLGRELGRSVLVDDTPLTFCLQPDNGIPVLPFKGDIDDRMLTEAVLPLLEALSADSCDVSKRLARRFNMKQWFAANGVFPSMIKPVIKHIAAPAPAPPQAPAMHRAPSAPVLHNAPASQILNSSHTSSDVLFVTDFDKTLVDWDSAERLCDEIAPELTSLLHQVETPANFIPVTNAVFAQMHSRQISREKIAMVLREMAAEVPSGTARMLRWAESRKIDVKILSDANTMLISHILAGAKLHSCISEVVTNPATFQRVENVSLNMNAGSVVDEQESSKSGGWFFGKKSTTAAAGNAAHYKLVVQPRHDHTTQAPHNCPFCPANLCKGRELHAMCAVTHRKRIIYAGDGANDLCPALCLSKDDVVLARAGYPLEKAIREVNANGGDKFGRKVMATVHLWRNHDELATLMEDYSLLD